MYDIQSSFINCVPFVMEISHCATQLISQGNICIAERGDAAVTGGTTGIYSSSKWRWWISHILNKASSDDTTLTRGAFRSLLRNCKDFGSFCVCKLNIYINYKSISSLLTTFWNDAINIIWFQLGSFLWFWRFS